jgi:hypothetical protein
VATELGVGRLLGKELLSAAERRSTEVRDAVR